MTATLALHATAMSQTHAHQETVRLLHEHGLAGWKVKMGNARRTAGTCNPRDKTITLSRHLLALRSFEDSMMTITHEIAHAIVGVGHGHDLVWARKHRELGGDGQRCFEMEGIDPTATWVGTCPHGKEFARFRRPKRLDGWSCRCAAGPSRVVWESRR